jgi:hypothetical protein
VEDGFYLLANQLRAGAGSGGMLLLSSRSL